jgi:Domain of unknown function (DUF4288)
MSNESWYSAKCIFLHSDTGHGPKQMYEERVVLLRANSVDVAIERAEREAEEYCRDLDGCKYLGYVLVGLLCEVAFRKGSVNWAG